MTIQEAIKSGKRFKRLLWDKFYENVDHTRGYDEITRFFTLDEIMATDWEIEEQKITITARQLFLAFDVAVIHSDKIYYIEKFKDLSHQLGFR